MISTRCFKFPTQALIPHTSTQRCVFSSFFFGGFITVIVVNSLERKLAQRISVQYLVRDFFATSYNKAALKFSFS